MRKADSQPRCPDRKKRRSGQAGQDGYILLAVLFLALMVLILLAVAAPKMAADIQRDRELELVHRGQQYVRAIKMYYKKFGAYPPNMDALEKSNEIRFLRKRYKDPMTGKDDWHLIHFGENKTPSYGFFGQPISGAGGSTVVGVGPGGTGGQNLGGSATGGPLFGGSSLGGSSGSASANGTSSGSGTDPNAVNSGAQNGNGTTTGTGTGTTTGSGSGTDSSSGSSSGFGSNSNPLTVGGLGIIGVESTSPKLGILIWKKKTHYNEWEFWYDPQADRVMMSNNLGAVGQPAGSTTQPVGSSGTNQSGSSGSSNSSGSSSSGTSNTQQPTTQQQ